MSHRIAHAFAWWLVACALGAAAPSRAAEGEAAPHESEVVETARADAYTHLMRATIAARTEQMGDVVRETRRAIDLMPDEPDLLVESARLLVWADRRADAERLGGKALEIDPGHIPALRFLADLAAARGLGSEDDAAARSEALRLYEELYRLQGKDVDPQVLRMLTQLRIQTGDLESAILWVRRLVEQRPGDLMANRTLAQLLLQEGDRPEALRVLLRFLAEHPDEEDLSGFAEQLVRSLGAWQLVDDELTAHPPIGGGNSALHRLQAEARMRLGRVEAAAQALEQALATAPEDRWVRFRLGQAWRAMGRLADAGELLRGLVDEDGGSAEVWFELGQVLEQQRDLEGALAAYRSALGQLDGSEQRQAREAVELRMATVHIGARDWNAAQAVLDASAAEGDTEALELRARIAFERDDAATVRQAVKRLRGLDQPGLAAILEGELQAREGHWPRAAERFDEAIAALGSSVRRRIAAIYVEYGRPGEGVDVLREWARQEPEDADVRFFLGDLLYRAERFSESEQQLREAFRIDPAHGQSLNYLGYSLAERNERLDEALDLVTRALATESWNGAYLDSLGWVYFRMGRYEEAVTTLERAVRQIPNDPTILEHLGDAYARVEDDEKALAAWNRALGAHPEDPETLRDKIARLLERGAPTTGTRQVSDGATVEGHLTSAEEPRPRPH